MKRLTLTILSVLMCCHALVAQQNPLTGKAVLATTGEGLAGVMIIVKGSDLAVISDPSGTFSLDIPSYPATLVFSLVGMETQEMTVADARTQLEVRLNESSTLIDDVVVVGYGTMRKSDLTGAVSSLKSEQVTESHMLSLDQAIAGKVAGVNIINTSGEPGGGLTINIRGVGSINADTEPLYVIDGAPMYRDSGLGVGGIDGLTGGSLNPMSGINPQDIESIEVLKDASSTAIYGSRGANGVVLVTTKSGKKGDARITLNSYAGFSFVSKKIGVLNGHDFIDMHVNDYKTPDYVTNQDTYLQGPMYNWQDEILEVAPKQEHVVSINGGTDRTSYSMSAGYTDQSGVVDKSDYKRFTARARIDQNIGQRMKAGINIMFSKFDQVGTASEGSKDNGADVFQQMLSYRPANVRFNENDLNDSGELGGDFNAQTNPVDYIKYAQMKTANSRLMLNTYLQYTLAKNVVFKTSYNYGLTDTKGSTFFPRSLAAGSQQNGRARKGFAKRDNWSWENIVTFDRSFGKNHKINAVAGFTMEKQQAYNFSQGAENFPDSYAALPEINLGSALTITAPVETANSSTMMSYLARVNYTIKDRYLFTASFRADGSSKFPAGRRFGYFPSAAFAWRVIQEPFMRNARHISDLKIRLSYGQTGNQSVAPYSSQALYGASYYSFNTGAGLSPSSTLYSGVSTTSIANPFLTWETTEQWNAGVDIGLFNNRVSLSVDAYLRDTYDLLLSRPVLLHTGYSNMMSNSGNLTNRGIEFSLNTVNIDKKSFGWTSTLNLSLNRNRVENLGENAVLRFSSHTDFQENFVLAAGQPVGTMFGYQVDGVYSYSDYKNFYEGGDPANGMLPRSQWYSIYHRIWVDKTEAPVLVDGSSSVLDAVPQIGYPKYRDVDGNGNISADGDRTFIGRSDPKFYGGFINNFTFKGFDMNVFVQFSYGNKFFVNNYKALSGYNTRNMLKYVYDNAWRPYRDSQVWPDYTIDSYKTQSSTLWIEDGSYLKIKDVTIGYTFSEKLLGKSGIKNLRVYVSGQNLITFTKFKWYDPETAHTNPIMGGSYRFKFPSSTTLLMGISVTF